ncbi:bacterio-opsin activator domain-containing protein [Halobacteriales archaeon Cl-PHB]
MATDEARRASQFDAVFSDPHTLTWVLDGDGRLERANDAARELAGDDHRVDAPFWDQPWWAAASAETVKTAVDRVLDGTFETAEAAVDGTSGARTLELTVRPVDTGDGVTTVVVDGRDVTERDRLERELRESEELHRVTLNNMTDTVLITDDEGRFTYVCPNVHFIFGYTAEEIHDLGTIDALLGDVVDRDDLAEAGVLTNVECTAEDKAGREHTLLVNAREVSIQGGTVLYSCRDVTKRKEREEALTALHRTTRELLYAETAREIGRLAVDDAADVLDLDASAVFLFDDAGSVLEPVAHSQAMERLHGPLPALDAAPDSLVGQAFVADETTFYADVHETELLRNPATDVRSCGVVPLGDHGVFVAGSPEVGVFDDVARELTDLLAATVEAALDRVERESRLRSQERELQHRNRELTAVNRINEFIREIDGALVGAESREEIERAVCEKLTAADRFAFAWIGERDQAGGRLAPRVWAGEGHGYLDSVDLDLETGTEPAVATARDAAVTVVDNVTDDLRSAPWRPEALSRDYQSALSVPLAYDEVLYGVLTVYAGTAAAFDETVRAVLVELGETIASAISAVERKSALLSTAHTLLTYEVADEGFVLQRLAAATGAQVTYEGGVQQADGGVRLFVSLDGTDAETAREAVVDLVSVSEAQVIGDREVGGVLRLELADAFLAEGLADHGAVLQRVVADADGARLTVQVPESVDVRAIGDLVGRAFADAALVSKQPRDHVTPNDLSAEFYDRLTDRQLEVIQAAYYGGYFESPRESTGEDIAAALDISPPAFYRHARTVQRKLFDVLFEASGSAAGPSGDVQ